MHLAVLVLGEERVLALDAATLHVLIPALGVVRPHQRRLALPRAVELDVLHLVLPEEKRGREEEEEALPR